MRKLAIAFILINLVFVSAGCSKTIEKPYFNLIYDGYTMSTTPIQYEENNKIIYSYKRTLGINYLDVKQYSKLEFKTASDVERCLLQIQKEDSSDKLKEIFLNSSEVITDIPPGKYIYEFTIEWNNSSAKFIKQIAIKK